MRSVFMFAKERGDETDQRRQLFGGPRGKACASHNATRDRERVLAHQRIYNKNLCVPCATASNARSIEV